jgi:tyrosine-protein kinase Etk/Wzc
VTDRLPVPHEPAPLTFPASPPTPSGGAGEGLRLGDIKGLLQRNWWVILGLTIASTGAALAYVFKTTPIYESGTTIQVEEKEANLPGIFRSMGLATGLSTEIEVLRSRSLAEDAVADLGLRLVVTSPRDVPRSRLLRAVHVPPDAKPAKYVLEKRGPGCFGLRRVGELGTQTSTCNSERLEANGLAFALTAEASRYDRIELEIQDLETSTALLSGNLTVSLPNRDALILVVRYKNPDPELVWQVPNTIAKRFIERRQQAQTNQARSAVAFLRRQLDTLKGQLAASEEALRQFREKEQVVDPEVEASTQVTRYVDLQARRGTLEAERTALASLLRDVQAEAARSGLDQPSPYRRLLAFPTLIGNQTASNRLAALAVLEDQRAALLTRRTPTDPDVEALSTRITGIEEELRLSVTTYLEGLANQVASLDENIGQYGQDLARVPQRQLSFARLQRQPKVLEEMYSLLQTRLKEAEISEGVTDMSVRVVDRAVRPLMPVWPRKRMLVMAGFAGGLLLGVGASLLREVSDRSIHSRNDVQLATGLPVLGLIPRIPGRGKFAVIAHRVPPDRVLLPAPPPKAPPRSGAQKPRYNYTFLPPIEVEAVGESAPSTTPGSSVPLLPQSVHTGPRMTIVGTGTVVTEAYGALQTNLFYSRSDSPLRTLVFTSPVPGEGKTTNAANLALTLAQRGVKVVLVDADMRRGLLHQLFEIKQEPGLTDILTGSLAHVDAVHSIRVDGGESLHVIAAGRPPQNPVALLESPAMRQLISELQERFEVVILDAPPVNMLTDAAVLGARAEGVIIVVRAGETQTGALEYALHQLKVVRAPVLGVVLNDVDFKRDAAYDATYRYYQYEGYSSRSDA